MKQFPDHAFEQAKRVEAAIQQAMAGTIRWEAAATSLGISARQMRRWRRRYELQGLNGLFDRRLRKPGPRVVPTEVLNKVIKLYREKYRHLSVRQFHGQIGELHGIHRSYTWVKAVLQDAGLVTRRSRGAPRTEPKARSTRRGSPTNGRMS